MGQISTQIFTLSGSILDATQQVSHCNPVAGCAVLGWQHPFSGLQADAVTTFKTFQNLFSLFAPALDDFGQLFQQGFGHGYMVQ